MADDSQTEPAFNQAKELAAFEQRVAEYGAPYFEMRRRGVPVAKALAAIHQDGQGAGPAVLIRIVMIAENLRVGAAHDLVYDSLLPEKD